MSEMRASSSPLPAYLRGLALSADTLSAAFLLGAAGAVYAWGFDGLAFGLGLGAGVVLLQLLIAPGLAASDARSLPQFFAMRFPGRAPRFAACAAVVASMAPLLIAQLLAGGLTGARLLGLDLSSGIAVTGAALVLCFALKRSVGSLWLAAAVFVAMLVAVLLPTIDLSAQWYGIPVPQLAHSGALWKAQELEETLLFDDLADPTYMRTLIRPFLSLSLMNFLGLVLGLAVGTASLAHVLARHVLARNAHAVRWGLVWALGFAAVLLTAAVAAAAYFKVALLTLIAGHVEIAKLPDWIFTYGRIGLLEVCGQPATDAATVAAACAQLPDASPLLRLQDLTFSPDMVLLALPEVAGLGSWMAGLIAMIVIVTAIVTAEGPLRAIVGAMRNAEEPSGVLAIGIAAGVVVLASLAAATRPGDVLTVATWAFLIAGASLFPALAAGVWWRRTSAAGVVAGVLTGLAVCLFYLIGTRYFAIGFYETWTSLSSAGPMATEFFNEYKDAWQAAEVGVAKDAAWRVLDAHAQTMADWWGVRPVATALLALPAAIVVLVVVSLLTPQRHRG